MSLRAVGLAVPAWQRSCAQSSSIKKHGVEVKVWVKELKCPAQNSDSDLTSLNNFGINWNWSLHTILTSASDLNNALVEYMNEHKFLQPRSNT